MNNHWIKTSPSLTKGIITINRFDDSKFEQFIRRILAKLKHQDTEIFTEDERSKLETIFKIDGDNIILAIRTVLYLFKRMLKYVFMPLNLKNDLRGIGLSNEKTEVIVKIWSTETKATLDGLGSEAIFNSGDSLNFSWKLNAELSSDCCKKSKIPKTYLSFIGKEDETEIEFTHTELYSVFLQFETIQNELDNLL